MKKEFFAGRKDYQHGEKARVGVLITNLGTPDAPTAAALRPYLREFLSDPRVIEISKPIWWLILNLFILPFRPKASAELYQKVWTEKGSPLLLTTNRQAELVAEQFKQRFGDTVVFAVGMRYGNPSIASAMRQLRSQGITKLLILPMYPQYCSATTGSTFDAVAAELSNWRWIPELRMISTYHDNPRYIAALIASVRERWDREGMPDKLLFSFHGIPKRYFTAGDPYHCFCQKTARLVAEGLGLNREQYLVCFQSQFGKEEWIKPYTIDTVGELATQGVRSLDVICPGFTADCLETLEEIEGLNQEEFLHKGGKKFRYIAALNERQDFIDALVGLLDENMRGWSMIDDSAERKESYSKFMNQK